jgi:hypothetical protein
VRQWPARFDGRALNSHLPWHPPRAARCGDVRGKPRLPESPVHHRSREALDAGTVASGAGIKLGEPGEALHREALDAGRRVAALDVPCCRARTDAGGALGREALDAATVAPSASATAPPRGITGNPNHP